MCAWELVAKVLPVFVSLRRKWMFTHEYFKEHLYHFSRRYISLPYHLRVYQDDDLKHVSWMVQAIYLKKGWIGSEYHWNCLIRIQPKMSGKSSNNSYSMRWSLLLKINLWRVFINLVHHWCSKMLVAIATYRITLEIVARRIAMKTA